MQGNKFLQKKGKGCGQTRSGVRRDKKWVRILQGAILVVVQFRTGKGLGSSKGLKRSSTSRGRGKGMRRVGVRWCKRMKGGDREKCEKRNIAGSPPYALERKPWAG